MTFGSTLQSLRESQGLSQKDLAKLIGVTTGVVAEWEADDTAPNLTELSRLSKALGVSSDVLLDATAEVAATPVAQFIGEPTPVITKPKKHKKTGLIVSAFVAGVLVVAAILLLSGLLGNRTSPTDETTAPTKPMAFAENTSAIEIADASVVTIFCYDYEGELSATGSGFVAFDGKTIITNYHVMTSAYTCKISTNQDISYEVSKILCYSKDQDIAILQLAKDAGLQPLTLGDSSIIKKGETVVAIGSPLGIKNTLSTGVLSGRLMEDNMDVLQFTAPISSGSSGGALFDNNGNVIGITFASIIDGQNLNLAIPIELAIKLYNSKGIAKSVSTICVEEYPYITYLSEYKNAPTVTLADLKQNPEKYNNKIVRLSIYVSSSGKNGKYWWDEYTWYFSEKNDVSLNYEYDGNLHNNVSFREMPLILCNIFADDAKYIDETLAPGDKIEVIAKFDFHPKGEETGSGPYPRDNASLDAILVWKK